MAKNPADYDAESELARNFKVVGEFSDKGIKALARLLINLAEAEVAGQSAMGPDTQRR